MDQPQVSHEDIVKHMRATIGSLVYENAILKAQVEGLQKIKEKEEDPKPKK